MTKKLRNMIHLCNGENRHRSITATTSMGLSVAVGWEICGLCMKSSRLFILFISNALDGPAVQRQTILAEHARARN
jgi:hypothetical protein